MANISTINVKGTSYDIDAVTVNGKTVEKNVPSNAVFTDTTYSAGSGLTLSSTTFNHTDTITAGTAGTSSATSGSTAAIPYVTYNSTGHITAKGTHTHTINGFLPSSGGTITGNLKIQNEDVTIGTTSNNGVSSGTKYRGAACTDSNDYVYAQHASYANSSGDVVAYMEAKNMKTDGTEVANVFRVGVKKDGTRFYYCSDPAKLRSDFSIQDALSTTTSTTGTDGFNVRKYGNVVQIQGNGITANKRGTVPSAYRPDSKIYPPCIVYNGTNWYFGFLEISTAGAITVHYLNGTTNSTTTSSSYTVYVCATWEIS